MAAMVVLERLTPPQRVAFVLHEAMDLPFADIAEILDCPVATARQHASRARRIVADADPPPRAAVAEQEALLSRFADAVARADHGALVALLHPDVVLLNDSGGRVSAARRPVLGPDKVARLLLGPGRPARPRACWPTGRCWSTARSGSSPGRRRRRRRGHGFAVRDGLVTGVHSVLNPEKLTRLPR